MGPESVSAGEFETMVVDALDSLPEFLVPMMREIAVLVEDEQPVVDRKRGQLLLGVYPADPARS